MNISLTDLQDVSIIENPPFEDHRGSFSRLFCKNDLAGVIGNREVLQVNYSCTSKVGTIRGLHYQLPPNSEFKMVRCLRGRVWDVVVDLRNGSPTFLQWHAEELTPENGRMLVIPEGCAHGFQVLEAESELLYLHTAYYSPSSEGGIRFDEPRLEIRWPLPVVDVSERDLCHQLMLPDYSGIIL